MLKLEQATRASSFTQLVAGNIGQPWSFERAYYLKVITNCNLRLFHVSESLQHLVQNRYPIMSCHYLLCVVDMLQYGARPEQAFWRQADLVRSQRNEGLDA